METVMNSRIRHNLRYVFRFLTLKTVIVAIALSILNSCWFPPDGYNEGFFNHVQPNVVDFIEIDTESTDDWGITAHIFDFGGTLYAFDGDVLHIISTDPFEVLDSYEFPWASDNSGGIKGATDETGKMWFYVTNTGELYSINEEEHIIEPEEGPYDILQNFDNAVTYFFYNEQDYVAGWSFGEGVQIYNSYDGSLAVQIPLPPETRVVATEFIGDALYIIYAPMVPSTSNITEPLTVTMKGFAAEDLAATEDGIYDNWEGSIDLEILKNAKFWASSTYNSVEYRHSEVLSQITGNGLLIYRVGAVDQGFPELFVYDLAGTRKIATQSDWNNRRSACLSHTGDHYYILTSEGVYKYRVP